MHDAHTRRQRDGTWALFVAVVTGTSAFLYFSGRASGLACAASVCASWLIYCAWEPLEEIPCLGWIVKLMSYLILPAFMATLYGMDYYAILSRW